MTFLFTDIEGSTLMVQRLGDRWGDVLARHDAIIAGAITGNHGQVVKTDGDSFFAVFEVAADGVAAAVAAQRALAGEPWDDDAVVRVRMGLHTGIGALGGSNYFGLDVHRASRIADAGNGGQMILSEATSILVERSLPPGVSLMDLGKHRFKDLSDPETIMQMIVEGLPREFGPLRTLDAVPNNLPAQLTSFVGRESELEDAVRLLESTRILTFTGPGGTGKTRLALQLAGQVSDQFADGVYFIDLSPVTETSVVASTILGAIGMAASSQDETPEDRLVDQLRDLQVLLVLDNFEQVIGAAPVMSALVRNAPGVKLVATSRSPLRIAGEQEVPVPPLAAPGGRVTVDDALQSEGVRLLIERTRAVRPDFDITPENVGAIVELVNRLDGLPLAIELVASRLRLFPVETVVSRLDTRMLSSGSVDLPERQRTIHNTISWSYDLLDAESQRLFSWLSVFSGWSRLDEVEALLQGVVEGDLVDGMERLVDHSLVFNMEKLGSPWFRILFVIREFARERLRECGEWDEAHRLHLSVFGDLVRRAAPEMLRAQRLFWFDLLEANHDNIRAAIDWGCDAEAADDVLDLVSSAWRFWQARGHLHEAEQRIELALSLPGATPARTAKALEALGGIQWWRGLMDECTATYRKALEMQRELGESRDLAAALYNYGLSMGYNTRDFDTAHALTTEAEEMYGRLEDDDGLGDVAWGRGNLHLAQDELDEAYECYVAAADRYRVSGNEFGVGWSLFEAGYVLTLLKQHDRAWPVINEALSLFWGHHDISGVVMNLFQMAGIARALGDLPRSHRLLGAMDALRTSSGVDIVGLDINSIEGIDLDRLDDLEGEDAVAFAEGAAMTLPEAVAYGLRGPTDS